MPKRKKHPKLPNGYGSIKYLGKNRRNPYGVYPPVTEFNENGVPIGQKAICYVRTWTVGFAVLTAWHAGTYEKGMELLLPDDSDQASSGTLIQNILANYNRLSVPVAMIEALGITPDDREVILKIEAGKVIVEKT